MSILCRQTEKAPLFNACPIPLWKEILQRPENQTATENPVHCGLMQFFYHKRMFTCLHVVCRFFWLFIRVEKIEREESRQTSNLSGTEAQQMPWCLAHTPAFHCPFAFHWWLGVTENGYKAIKLHIGVNTWAWDRQEESKLEQLQRRPSRTYLGLVNKVNKTWTLAALLSVEMRLEWSQLVDSLITHPPHVSLLFRHKKGRACI